MIVDNFSRVSPAIGVKAKYQGTDVVETLGVAPRRARDATTHPGGQRSGVSPRSWICGFTPTGLLWTSRDRGSRRTTPMWKAQWDPTGRMPGCSLFQYYGGGLPTDTRLEIGIQCESSSQGPGGAHATWICETDRG